MVIIFAFKYLGDDKGEVFGRDQFLGITQFDNSRQYPLLVFFGQLQPQCFEIFGQRCFAAHLAQCVTACAGEALWAESGLVKTAFAVSICVNACRLREYVGPDNGCICGYSFARERFNHSTKLYDVAFID